MYEGLLAVLALGIVVLFREDVKRAFPFHRPTIAKTVGTLLMWIGTLLITMIPTSILLYVFPERVFRRFLTEFLPFSGYEYAGLPDVEE